MESTPVPVPPSVSTTGGGMKDVLSFAKSNWQLILIGVLVVVIIIMSALWMTGHFQDLPPSNQSTGSTNSLWWFGGGDAGADIEDYKPAPGESLCHLSKSARVKVEEAEALMKAKMELTDIINRGELTEADMEKVEMLSKENYVMAPGEAKCMTGHKARSEARANDAEAAKVQGLAKIAQLMAEKKANGGYLSDEKSAELYDLQLEHVDHFDPYNPRGVNSDQELLEGFEDIGPRGLAAIRVAESGGQPVMQ